MTQYIYQLPDWPKFTWDHQYISSLLSDMRHLQGKLVGEMMSLGFQLQSAATMQMLTEDVLKTSEIEGEVLDKEQVRSSVAKRLGIESSANITSARNVEGVVEMMCDATQRYNHPLTTERLFSWHAALFPTGRSGMTKIAVGRWRKADSGTMQVISGPMGRERVHFEAPQHDVVEREMSAFLHWYNDEFELDLVLKSAIAHLWFLTIHPFDDGNGRIARAIADMLLAKSEKCGQRFYSMSSQIRLDRRSYYLELERAQKGSLDITNWIDWFLHCLRKAMKNSEDTLQVICNKSRFWQKHQRLDFNTRQKQMLNIVLDDPDFVLTSSKWSKICHCSQDTANRDINDLLTKGVLRKGEAEGRSTHYELLNLDSMQRS